ncbi:hypothetical protein M8C21_032714 [Ambrosia artemisiifolia]|uniref:YLP motif-containing protein 1 n=1 Tax=Ambrosia artemisiifolia TaxID=4212 RepID=A0AAD5G1A3_AMBAR|nr:hypothetical protein M8C21_032714 [Ambrosia artemisiifolia]
MDHPWRPPPPPPPIPGNPTTTNICPICSISHFPFCPSPIENPRFHYPHPPHDYYHHPPPPPFNHHPLPNHNINNNNNNNYYSYSNSSHNRPPTWHGSTNPCLNLSQYDGIIDHNLNNNYHYGYDGYNNGYDNAGMKRIRIEPVDNNNNNNIRGPRGLVMGGEIGDVSRFPSDNERILKLIHDHGNDANAMTSGPPTVGAGLFSESSSDVGLKLRREATEILSMASDYHRHSGQPAVGRSVDVDNHNSQAQYYWTENKGHYGANHGYCGQPPLPASPPPPLPEDMPRNHFYEPHASATPPPPPPPKQTSLLPVGVSSSVDASSGSAFLENQSAATVYYGNNANRHASSLSAAEEFHIRQSSSEKLVRDVQPYPLRRFSSEKQDSIDASQIFKKPHRASRPDHFVIILRGLPGSGKSYLAKMLRDIEVENGGQAPRIHSMDEYFMVEVEKAEDSELSKSSGSLRGKRQVMKTVMEYCYEPEMEEAYRASMLKAFKKTLDEGVYSFIIVDDRNLRVADFAQFWATAKRSGYEVYLVEASYKDPAGCAARNVHNFTLSDIQKMAGQWEEAPPLYLKMDIKSLLHGGGLVESGIQEVDMDMEDEDVIDASQESDVKRPHDETKDQVDDFRPHDELKDVTVTTHQTEEVKALSRSKWSNNFDAEEEDGKKEISVGALSGLVQAYSSKEGKSVCWGDQGGNVGFSISATRKTNSRSLVIGPGPGYNLKSNPLSEEEYIKPSRNAVEPITQSVFQERIRAERESFKAVFDKRRQRISGFNMDDE